MGEKGGGDACVQLCQSVCVWECAYVRDRNRTQGEPGIYIYIWRIVIVIKSSLTAVSLAVVPTTRTAR